MIRLLALLALAGTMAGPHAGSTPLKSTPLRSTPPRSAPQGTAGPHQPPAEAKQRPTAHPEHESRPNGDAPGRLIDGPRGRGRLQDGESRGLPLEKMKAVMEVANDLNPKWADDLRAKFRGNPEGMRRALLKNGPRLMALVALREENEKLYKLKVGQFQLQGELKQLGDQYQEAKAKSDEVALKELDAKIRQRCLMLNDIVLKADAEELYELDRQLQNLKAQVTERIAQRNTLINDLIDSVLAGNYDPRRLPQTRHIMPADGETAASQPASSQPEEAAKKPSGLPRP